MSVQTLLSALDERTIAREVGIPHDEARMAYGLQSNTVESFEEFTDIIADYYNYHFGRCVGHGGNLSRAEAAGRARELLEREARKRNGNILSAYQDASDGTAGGVRRVLDILAEGLKAESVERYIQEVFDTVVDPSSWLDKVELLRQFFGHYGAHLSSSIDFESPERYAQNYIEVVSAYNQALQQTSSVFRRL